MQRPLIYDCFKGYSKVSSVNYEQFLLHLPDVSFPVSKFPHKSHNHKPIYTYILTVIFTCYMPTFSLKCAVWKLETPC